jgi:tRNA modification GTPase
MRLDLTDTIAAIASPPGASPRGVVRVSGPDALAIIHRLCDSPFTTPTRAARIANVALRLRLNAHSHTLPCDLFIWPTPRSYTREPTVEIHTIGSPPILEALTQTLCENGARLAEPGEFTLRAVLAGRMDLVQAEAVLGVIDAQHEAALAQALTQLAGGVSAPLHALREELLMLLAELEAGLDFVEEEDVRFIEPAVLAERLAHAEGVLNGVVAQLQTRTINSNRPRVVIVGPPNAGKSSLFNALVKRCGGTGAAALVADLAGTTRDTLTAIIRCAAIECELVDTAGADESPAVSKIDALARTEANAARRHADLLLDCGPHANHNANTIALATKSDLTDRGVPLACRQWDVLTDSTPGSHWRHASGTHLEALPVSTVTGEGLDMLIKTIATQLDATLTPTGMTAATASRCEDSLRSAAASLTAAHGLALHPHAEDLLAAELRTALDHLGRVVGAVVTDDILDRIFSKFCIGK